MSTKAARGTKRTCQSSECGSRFYDLNRDPIVCPICGSIYEIAHSTMSAAALQAEEKAQRAKAKRAEFEAQQAGTESELPAVEGEEALVEEGEETVAAEEDETFLEEEEEGGDMSNIIGGPVAEGEEEA